jgi:hypothetical protein
MITKFRDCNNFEKRLLCGWPVYEILLCRKSFIMFLRSKSRAKALNSLVYPGKEPKV